MARDDVHFVGVPEHLPARDGLKVRLDELCNGDAFRVSETGSKQVEKASTVVPESTSRTTPVAVSATRSVAPLWSRGVETSASWVPSGENA